MREFNQAYTVPVPADLTLTSLTATIAAVIRHHDALRARLTVTADGTWQLEVPEADHGPDVTALVHRVESADPAAVAAETEAARRRLDPERGIMLQAVWFDHGPDTDGVLLLVVHHLVVDGVSWRILLPDLAAAYAGGELEPVGTSLLGWSQALTDAATHPRWTDQLPYWQHTLTVDQQAIGKDYVLPARDTLSTAQSHTITLTPGLTRALLTTVPAAYNAGVNDVLLTALALAARQWRPEQTRDGLLLDLESHGRHEDALDAGHDLTRTVGWFTSMHPVRLTPPALTWTEVTTAGPANGTALKEVKEQLRAVPDHGLGYGLLRYLNPATATTLAAHPAPQIGFNYLGRFTTDQGTDAHWLALEEADTAVGDAELPFAHALDINAATHDTPDGPQLQANLAWPAALFDAPDVEHLAALWQQALQALRDHIEHSEAGGLTPSDLTLVGLSQRDIDLLEEDESDYDGEFDEDDDPDSY
ncbi:condensation domain-containing protein [Kitasatospora acidiphila]|uniref:condensation domain-containing protein n=1 Tax=Kitasatospora acidiphila TaxID=2567942 RepID=UPI0015F0D7FB|nr:condensation domain-containing protein [Kitasatospora acidiphila]